MGVDRLLPTPEAEQLIDVARQIAQAELAPRAVTAEADHAFPRDVFAQLGELGLLGMPYDERFGGAGLSYEVYLQALEELGAAWASVAIGVSVHVMSCYPLEQFGTDEQRQRWLPEMVGGDLLGGYCLSESDAGSDPAAMRCAAVPVDGGYRLRGSKAWVTHGGEADFYTVFARTSDHRSRGISCFLVPADADGLSAGKPESKMGLTGSTTATIELDDVFVATDRRVGDEGQGLQIALSALDSGRLGVASVAVGLGQAAVDHAVRYASERETFGQPIIEHQGLGFLLAEMATAVDSARATVLDAARRRDRERPFARQASVAKLVATDAAMRVTTDAVQVLGGAGYTTEFPVERFMREAKIMQIFEGTNQIQRMVISRHLRRDQSTAAA